MKNYCKSTFIEIWKFAIFLPIVELWNTMPTLTINSRITFLPLVHHEDLRPHVREYIHEKCHAVLARVSLICWRAIELPIVLFPSLCDTLRERKDRWYLLSRLEEAITLHGLPPRVDSTSFKMAVDQSPCYPCIDTAVCTCINGVIQDRWGTIASTNSSTVWVIYAGITVCH